MGGKYGASRFPRVLANSLGSIDQSRNRFLSTTTNESDVRPRLGEQEIQHVDIVVLAIGDVQTCRSDAAQIQQGMQLNRDFGPRRRHNPLQCFVQKVGR